VAALAGLTILGINVFRSQLLIMYPLSCRSFIIRASFQIYRSFPNLMRRHGTVTMLLYCSERFVQCIEDTIGANDIT